MKINIKPLLSAILVVITINCYAQKASEKASSDICECVEKKLPTTEQQHVQDSVSRCFGQAMAVHMEGLNKEFKIKSVTVESIFETREKLLKVLRKKCEYFKK